MFNRDIQRIMDDMQREMERAMRMSQFGGRSIHEQEYDGHRVEVVDGDVTEQYLVDGEWVDKREFLEQQNSDDDSVFDLMDGTFTIDLSSEITGEKAVAEANINNGVLTVEFETRTEDDE